MKSTYIKSPVRVRHHKKVNLRTVLSAIFAILFTFLTIAIEVDPVVVDAGGPVETRIFKALTEEQKIRKDHCSSLYAKGGVESALYEECIYMERGLGEPLKRPPSTFPSADGVSKALAYCLEKYPGNDPEERLQRDRCLRGSTGVDDNLSTGNPTGTDHRGNPCYQYGEGTQERDACLEQQQMAERDQESDEELGVSGDPGDVEDADIGATANEDEEKKATLLSDPVRYFSCLWGNDSLPDILYQVTFTDIIYYELFSKSTISTHISNVDILYNWMINFSSGGKETDTDFKSVNEEILGTTLTAPITEEDIEYEETLEYNGGPKVNPYDRFGLAGLRWTGYKGEFYSVLVRPCENLALEEPLNGHFYPERKIPLSRWEDLEKTHDPRTAVKNTFEHDVGTSFGLVVANFLFGFTKFVVALTITLINLSFTNLVELFSIDKLLVGDSGDGGLVNSLYLNIFQPFIVMIMVLTGLHILWVGIVKRGYREAIGVLVRSVGFYILAIIIFTNPAWFIALPNNIAVVAQSVVISALGDGIAGGYGLCNSDISSKVGGITDSTATIDTTVEEAGGILEQASVNMHSAIGCQFWYTFAFRPWVEGQWGEGFENLWAEDADIDTTYRNPKTLGNQNGEWVGNAAVPMGGGTFLHNWAIFNLSVNTNAHSPYIDNDEDEEMEGEEVEDTAGGSPEDTGGEEGSRSAYISNVATDWWRIADAISNYDEEENDDGDVVPIENIETLDSWERWTGIESTGHKMGIAINSLLVALIGVIGPLIFALLSSVLAIEIALLMAVSPLMFLLASWANKGWEMFKGWGELVINTTLQRIIIGILMSVSIVLTMSIIKIIEAGGAGNWFKGVILLLLATLALVKGRKQLVDSMASIRFASVDMSHIRDRTKQRMGNIARTGGSIARGGYSGARGASAAKKQGAASASRFRGAMQGMREEVGNRVYSSGNPLLRAARTQAAVSSTSKELGAKDGKLEGKLFCQYCRRSIDPKKEGSMMRDDAGNLYCMDCYYRGDTPEDLDEMKIYVPEDDYTYEDSPKRTEHVKRTAAETINLDKLKNNYKDLDQASKQELVSEIADKIGKKLGELRANSKGRKESNAFEVPDFLKTYINNSAMEEEMRKFSTAATDKERDASLEKIAKAFSYGIKKFEDEDGQLTYSSEEIQQKIVDGANGEGIEVEPIESEAERAASNQAYKEQVSSLMKILDDKFAEASNATNYRLHSIAGQEVLNAKSYLDSLLKDMNPRYEEVVKKGLERRDQDTTIPDNVTYTAFKYLEGEDLEFYERYHDIKNDRAKVKGYDFEIRGKIYDIDVSEGRARDLARDLEFSGKYSKEAVDEIQALVDEHVTRLSAVDQDVENIISKTREIVPEDLSQYRNNPPKNVT